MFRALAVFMCLIVSLPASAYRDRSGPVRTEVIDRHSGRSLPQYPHRGQRWIPGQPGQPYSVRLTNRSDERVLVVLSVDGVNAISGETASPEQTGYVLEPWQSSEITGWRKSLHDVAEFYFTDLPDSYAGRTGRPFDVGVIGIAVFDEVRRYRPAPPIGWRDRGDYESDSYNKRGKSERAQAPAAAESKRYSEAITEQGLGTGHGERQWSPTRHTEFIRASRQPMQISQLRYDDPQGLASRGVIARPIERWAQHDRPQAFPGQFTADPEY